ncbi:MAG TPA: glycosyltransferase family 39 protein [Candidatus Polarisedimenticolia bacterium]|nr:glycosyltransferase family 39 protein [Candidatus Polarisedimenticolia bacterium]
MPAGEPLRRSELLSLTALAAATLALRVAFVFRQPFNSDEPQHLHVAWGWSRGLIQYRDLFDNHTPIFHMLSAPLVAVVGERPEILSIMRLAMIPLYLATLWGAFALATALFDRRTGLWATALLAIHPTFFRESLEYRADDLWMTFWVLALLALVGGDWSGRRAFSGGLLLGACLGTSLKTTLLLGSLGAAALLVPFVAGVSWRAQAPWGTAESDPAPRRVASSLPALLGGMAIVPSGIVLLFTSLGAFAPFLHGTVLHNLLPGLGRWSRPGRGFLVLPALLVVLAAVSALVRLAPPAVDRRRLALIALTAGIYLAALQILWPLFTRQDLLPFLPLLFVALAGLLQIVRRRPALGFTPLLAAAALEIGLLVKGAPPRRAGPAPETRLLEEVLRLTDPRDEILDAKGEAVFRRRPIYEVMESITQARLQRGDLKEEIPEAMIERGVFVATTDVGRFPERTRLFLEENFLPVGRLRVAGRFLPPGSGDPGGAIVFEVVIPARYAIVAADGAVAGRLDGAPYGGPIVLSAGRHLFVPAAATGRLALIWAQAIERGFSPFTTGDRLS